jgi:NSS family neurotransmitter:Na+ symporter
MNREKFGSRIGFLLISAGCAIGIGNVWRFPYVVGQNGGGAFVLIYLLFLAILGVPVLTMEYAIGRASGSSIIKAYNVLEPKGSKWHIAGPILTLGNYILMMFYTVVSGWMIYYFFSYCKGDIVSFDTAAVTNHFNVMLQRPGLMAFWMAVSIIFGMVVCSLGLQNGVEKITKTMMICLLAIMVVLAVRSTMLKGGMEGVSFYLKPDTAKIQEVGLLNIIVSAMNQAFFTLSIGFGSMMIFGSYLSKDRRLLGESISVAVLDTFVAIVSGLIIFPSCFAYGIEPDSGPSLIFITLPNVFNSMPFGRVCGALFFLFMSFASLSTVIGVFENINACTMDFFGCSRKKSCAVNFFIILIGSIPCVLGYNLWSSFAPFGEGTTVLDLEDYIVSNLMLPIGSFFTVLFCTVRYGWGFDKFFEEVNMGKGMKFPKCMRFYCKFILPLIIICIVVRGIFRM